MKKEEQSQAMDNEWNAIENMINEGGLGADVYYVSEGINMKNNQAAKPTGT